MKKSFAEQAQKIPDFGAVGGWESTWRSTVYTHPVFALP